MPPKKENAKDVAAKLKKENTLKAKEIVEQLRRETGKCGSDSIVKKLPGKKSEKTSSTDSKRKQSVQDKDIVDKSKRRSEARSNIQNKEIEAPVKASHTETVDCDSIEPATTSETIEHVRTLPKKSAESVASSSKESKTLSSTSKVVNEKSVRPPKARTSHGSGYQYEIDCKEVADSIDVKDLREHIQKHLKVCGKKNNLGSTISILCEGQKVVVKSATFLPKKCLRFLSKKFLKKNWNIRVLSKNAHSYVFKYVGAP